MVQVAAVDLGPVQTLLRQCDRRMMDFEPGRRHPLEQQLLCGRIIQLGEILQSGQ